MKVNALALLTLAAVAQAQIDDIGDAIDNIGDDIGDVIDNASSAIDDVRTFASGVGDDIATRVSDIGDSLETAASDLPAAASSILDDLASAIPTGAASSIWDDIEGAIASASYTDRNQFISAINEGVDEARSSLEEFAATATGEAAARASSALDQLDDFRGDATSAIGGAVSSSPEDRAPVATAAAFMGALFGGAAMLAQL